MRIDRSVVEEEVSTDEDIILAVDDVVFKKDVKCGNIVSEGYKRNITGKNINCGDIDCRNINCGDINCWDIEAGFVVCESRKKKNLKAKTVCYNLIIGRSKYEKKEAMK